MQIMGAKIEKPVQWIAGNIAGIAIPAYDLAGSPMGELPSYFNTLGWVFAGIVLVRLAALGWLIAHRNEMKDEAAA